MKSHPMGAVVDDMHFVWVKVVLEIQYHAIVVQGTADEARAAGIEAADNYELAAQTSRVLSIEPIVRPVREGHNVERRRNDIAYLRQERGNPE